MLGRDAKVIAATVYLLIMDSGIALNLMPRAN
jgi:hypothetical protein